MLHIFIFKSEKGYPAIKHSHDIWHAAKNLGKKLLMVSPECQKQTFSHVFFSFVVYIHILVFTMEQYVYQPSWFFFHFYKWAIQFSPQFQLQMKFEIISQVYLTCICRLDKRKAVGICRNGLEIFPTTSGIHANLLLALTISWYEFFIVLLKLNVTVGF